MTQEKRRRVYLDHNATTPVDSGVASALPEWASAWGNPSSIHDSGRAPKALMREARERLARLVGAHPLEVVFTSGGSEANNLAMKGAWGSRERVSERRHLLVSTIEHPSVKRTAEYLATQGAELEWIPVGRDGIVQPEEVRRRLRPTTFLVSVMAANNETGAIQPLSEISALAHAAGAWVHCDAVQMLGKVPMSIAELGADLVSFAGHKFYALKGSGFLYVRKGISIEPLIHGGGQERSRRGGTENVLAMASFGHMALRGNEIADRAMILAGLRDHLERALAERVGGVHITAGTSVRIPTTSSLVIDGVDGETLLMRLDLEGFSVSTGSACSSGSPEPSPVLMAMGLSREEAQSSLRVGIGWGNTREEIDSFVSTMAEIVPQLREMRSRSRRPASSFAALEF